MKTFKQFIKENDEYNDSNIIPFHRRIAPKIPDEEPMHATPPAAVKPPPDNIIGKSSKFSRSFLDRAASIVRGHGSKLMGNETPKNVHHLTPGELRPPEPGTPAPEAEHPALARDRAINDFYDQHIKHLSRELILTHGVHPETPPESIPGTDVQSTRVRELLRAHQWRTAQHEKMIQLAKKDRLK